MATLNDKSVFDFEAFLTAFSKLIFPLFVWSIWCYRYNCYNKFNLHDFGQLFRLEEIKLSRPDKMLYVLQRKVNQKIAWLQRHFPQGKKTYAPLRQQLLDLGLTPETSYLYMQGHTLFDNVVMCVLGPLCTMLRKEREKEITRLAVHETQRQNELSSYQHSQCPVDVMLRQGTGYKDSAPYQLLRADIRRLMDEVGLQK